MHLGNIFNDDSVPQVKSHFGLDCQIGLACKMEYLGDELRVVHRSFDGYSSGRFCMGDFVREIEMSDAKVIIE